MIQYVKYIFLVTLFVMIGCKDQEQPKPKVTYVESKTNVVPKVDTTQIRIADLPILMEGTKYLIHPIGDVRVYDDYKSVYGSSKTNQVSYAISNYNRFEFTLHQR